MHFSLLVPALTFAIQAHGTQKRKYTGDPYIVHPIAVANLLAIFLPIAPIPVMEAALLHDVIEDTPVTREALHEAFGATTATYVCEVTDRSLPSDGNRAKRKEIDRLNLSTASPFAKMIKIADLCDNTKSIIEHDPGFAKVYLLEKRKLLDVLEPNEELEPMWFRCHQRLLNYARKELQTAVEKLRVEP